MTPVQLTPKIADFLIGCEVHSTFMKTNGLPLWLAVAWPFWSKGRAVVVRLTGRSRLAHLDVLQ